MSSDIEIIDDGEQNKSGLYNLIAGDDSSDEEIVCLDTVFKPAGEAEKLSMKLLAPEAPSILCTDTNNIINPPPAKVNVFDAEEETIDDMVSTARNNNSLNDANSTLYNKLYNENIQKLPNGKRKKVAEPPVKKLKPHSKGTTEKSTAISQASSSKSVNTTQRRHYNPEDCTFPTPMGSNVLDLIVIILKNAKCLLVRELWDYISGLFPYFEYHFDVVQGIAKIRRIIGKFQTYFLRTTSEYYKKSMNKKLIMLNPVTKQDQQQIIERVKNNKEEFVKSLYTPEIFDSLLAENLNIFDMKFFHDRSPPSKSLCFAIQSEQRLLSLNNDISDVQVPITISNLPLLPSTAEDSIDQLSTGLYVDSLKDVDVLDLVDEGERADALSPKSSSSTDTIVFNPKIVNCKSLVDDEVEVDLLVDIEDSSSSNAVDTTGFQNKLLMQLEPMTSQGIGSESAFANTVWSNEDMAASNTLQINAIEMNLNQMDNDEQSEADAQNVTRFPEIDKCVPKWKEIFPWMDYKPWLKKIFCTGCQKILNKLESNTPIVVVEVNHPDDVFKVSKQLRTHSEKVSHKMALILENKAIISTLYFLLNSHFNEFNSIKEILSTFDDLFPSGVNFNQDTLKCTIRMLGEYLEDKIISKLKKLKKFSVITDPCSGLLVVRFVNEDDEPEEHIVSSYARVLDKTPTDYLTSLGVLTKYMIVYVTNSRCEECPRCKATKKVGYKNSTPLRLPSLDKYLVFLWRIKLLKPFYSIGSTLCKLWIGYPHKFTEIGKLVSLDKLSKFPSNPDAFIDVFQHFDKFQEIAKSIYILNGNLEALGFQTIDVAKYNWLLDVFPILTNINILFLEIKSVFPFHRDFDNLFHNAEKLKLFCEKAKEGLKEKKITVDGIDAADVDDLYNIVDLTVKEFQQPIYNKGRSVPLAYYRLTTLRNLNMYKTSASVKNTFIVLYSSIKSNYRFENTSLLLALTNFLTTHPNCEKKDAVTVLNYFKKNNEANSTSDNVVYAFYRLMAYYPFQPAKNERCIYETKVYEYLFYRSAWSSIGPNIKDYLLTIIYELSGKQMLSEKDILTWWKDRVK